MSISYGLVAEEYLEQSARLSSYVFGFRYTEWSLERLREAYPHMAMYGAVEDGQLLSKVANIHRRMYLNGGVLGCGAVAGVGTVPERRREGHLGVLLRQALSDMRDFGECVSMLYPTFYGLYQRFGYRMAAQSVTYKLKGNDLSLVYAPDSPGRVERLEGKDWPRLHAIYERVAAARNCWFVREEPWWRRILDGPPEEEPPFVALYKGAGGDSGYLLYSRKGLRQYGPNQEFEVSELVAETVEAQAGLLRFLQGHDLATEFKFWDQPLDDPLLDLVANPRYFQPELHPHMMLRIVDVPAALAQRPVLDQLVEGRLVLEVSDRTAPWNAGRWAVEVGAGKASARQADETADLSLDVGALTVLYNGFRSATRLERSGLLRAGSPAAVALADRVFAAAWQPICLDYF